MKSLHAETAALILAGLLALPGIAVADETAKPAGVIGNSADARAACSALIQLRGLPGPLMKAMAGDGAAFAKVRSGVDGLEGALPKARAASDNADKSSFASASTTFEPMRPTVDRFDKNAEVLVAHQAKVVQAQQALQAVSQQSVELLDAVQRLMREQMVDRVPAYDVYFSSQLAMLSQRIGKSASEFLGPEGMNADAVFLIGKDVQAFQELATNLQKGDRSLGLKPPRSKASRERAAQLIQQFEQTRQPVEQVLAGLQDLVAANEAQSHMLADAAALDAPLEAVCTGRAATLQAAIR